MKTVMRSQVWAIGYFLTCGMAPGASTINANAVNPNLFIVSTFTQGLNAPLGATQLSDGSLLVGVGQVYTDLTLLRFVDANNDRVAHGPGTTLYTQTGGGSVTALVKAGNYILAGTSNVSTNQSITVLQPGLKPGDPLIVLGSLNFAFPPGWDHYNMGAAVRAVLGQSNAYDAVFNVGSQFDAQVSIGKVTLSGLASAKLDGESLYMVRLQFNGSSVTASNLTKVATGTRNVVGMAFHPVTGDFYFADNAIDGPGADGDEPPQADELNKIPAAALGVSILNFGFPTCYVEYRTGAFIGSGCIQPVVAFQPLPNGTPLGQESEGPTQMVISPASFPAGFNNGVFVGFCGKKTTGISNEENALVYYDFGTGKYIHFFESGTPGGGLPIGLYANRNSLFIQDYALGTVTQIDAAPAGASLDLNADGKSDILWQHPSTGDLWVWFMNGTAYAGAASISPPTAWRVPGAADFNGDGKPDILWQHPSTGELWVWYMNGASWAGQSQISPATEWRVVGTGDFNGDGKPDILWQHPSTGELWVWYMNGASWAGQAQISPPTGWSVAGAADLNADGKPDILWQHPSTGELWVWFMNGASWAGQAQISPATAWKVVGTGDFNGDGKPDILWQHPATGELWTWLMNGSAMASGVQLGGATAWKAIGER